MLFTLNETIDLVNSANFLDIKKLVDLASARLAFEIINCTIEEGREKFGIVCNMTEEEMEEANK